MTSAPRGHGPVRRRHQAAALRAGLGPLGAVRLAEATALVRQAAPR